MGVEGNVKGSLFSMNETLGKCCWLSTESSKGMIKTGSLKKRGKIGVKQQGVLYPEWNNLKKPFAKTTCLEYYPENEVELKQGPVG